MILIDSLEFSPLIQECCKIYNPLAGVLWNYASSKPLGTNTFLWFTVSNTDIIQAKILVKLTTLPHIHHLLLENPAWFFHSCNSCSVISIKTQRVDWKIWEDPLFTVYVTVNESDSEAEEEHSTGRCDKCSAFSSFIAKLSLVTNEVSMILKIV